MSDLVDYEINRELGECYLHMGDYAASEGYYLKALSASERPEVYLGLATLAMQSCDFEKAMEYYSKSAAMDGNDKALTGMALIEMETGRHPEAFDHFCKALDLNPANLIAINGLMREGYNLQSLDVVVKYMRNFLEVAPENQGVRFSMAGCLIVLERKDEARAELELIMEKNPENQEARELYAVAS